MTAWYIRTTFPVGAHFRRKHFSELKEIYGFWKMSCFCCTNMGIDFHLFLHCLWKSAIAISTARYIRTTFPAGVHFRRKHFSYLKEKLDLPGHCYGSSKNGPYGPQGPWAQPLFDCFADALRVFFFGENSVPKQNNAYLLKKWRIFVILANVDLNLRFKICRIAI